MAYDLTWQFDINRVVASAATHAELSKWQLWYLKAFLKGEIGGALLGLWTCYYSCDSAAAGVAGDGVDRWGNPYNSAKIIRAAAGVAHSWMVLASPVMSGNTYYLIIDYASGTEGQAVFTFCATAPTGGTTLAAPTSTQSWGISRFNGVATASTYNSGATLTLPHKMHGMLSSTGQFHILSSRDTSGVFELAWGFQYLANTRINDLVPPATLMEYASAGIMVANTVAGGLGDIVATTGALNSRKYDNSGVNVGTAAVTPRFAVAGTDLTAAASWTAPDVADGTWPDWPIWIVTAYTVVTTITSNKGRWQDLAFTTLTLPSGTVDSAITPTFMTAGSIWFPTNAIPSL